MGFQIQAQAPNGEWQVRNRVCTFTDHRGNAQEMNRVQAERMADQWRTNYPDDGRALRVVEVGWDAKPLK